MQGNEDPKKGSGLEYHYLLVRDEYRDEQTQLGVWVMDGDAVYKNLLKYALNERNFGDTTIVLGNFIIFNQLITNHLINHSLLCV